MTPLDRVHAVASREDFGGRLEAIVLDGAQWLCGSRHGVVLALRSPSGEEATALPHGYVERDAAAYVAALTAMLSEPLTRPVDVAALRAACGEPPRPLSLPCPDGPEHERWVRDGMVDSPPQCPYDCVAYPGRGFVYETSTRPEPDWLHAAGTTFDARLMAELLAHVPDEPARSAVYHLGLIVGAESWRVGVGGTLADAERTVEV